MYVSLKLVAETFGAIPMAKDCGCKLKGEAYGELSAALGIIHRRGLGNSRHIQTGLLWVQPTGAGHRLSFGKIWGKQRPVDCFTTFLDEATSLTHIKTLQFNFTDGRADAPTLNYMSQPWHDATSGENDREWPWLQFVIVGRTGLKQNEVERTLPSSSPTQGSIGKQLGEDVKFLTRDASPRSSIAFVNAHIGWPVDRVSELGIVSITVAKVDWVPTGHGAMLVSRMMGAFWYRGTSTDGKAPP